MKKKSRGISKKGAGKQEGGDSDDSAIDFDLPVRHDSDEENKKKEQQKQQLSSVGVLGKRRATHLPVKAPPPPQPAIKAATPSEAQQPVVATEAPQPKPINLAESSYQQQQQEHLRTVERDKKIQQQKKARQEEDSDGGVNWAGNAAARNKAREAKKAGKDKMQQDIEQDAYSDDEMDMEREDEELEKILRDYNNEGKGKNQQMLDKPLDLPFYKRIQLPQHLKWMSIYSKQNESILMQEIHSLDSEIKRLKEVQVMHKEFRRFVEMPIGVMSKPCACCKQWVRKKHPNCSHQHCEKPCKKQLETPTSHPQQQHREERQHHHHHHHHVVKPPKEQIIQQQIHNVFLSTLQKIQQKQAMGGQVDSVSFDQSVLHQQTLSYLNMIGANNPFQGGQMTGIIFPMVDERNKRGRPPKKPKPVEQEQKEKQVLNQRIMDQLQQQQAAIGAQQQVAAAEVKIEQQAEQL
ncbi:hypothetical protein FGO68_gene7949 [Halteria grandinella]|uniref:Uncharacterized protein n=1 Tax=Halteria grandinella TaxID=5974 RepID=A0A8J8NNS1_HALGN|nr:hypothetical protein FGO68_gene7949 [Halteria grandinella]